MKFILWFGRAYSILLLTGLATFQLYFLVLNYGDIGRTVAAVVTVILFMFINLIFVDTLKRFIRSPLNSKSISDELKLMAVASLANIIVFAGVYYTFGIDVGISEAQPNTSIEASSAKYPTGDVLNSLYFSIVTWTTLGYGDIRPVPGIMQLVSAFQALLGYVYMSILIGLFISTANLPKDNS